MSSKFCVCNILLNVCVFWRVTNYVSQCVKQNQVKISAISFENSTFTLTKPLTLKVANKIQSVCLNFGAYVKLNCIYQNQYKHHKLFSYELLKK